MVKIVEITQSSDNIVCDDQGHAKIKFNVNSLSSFPIRIGAKILTEGKAKESWFILEEKSEITLNPDATDQFTFNVNAKGAPEGKYKIRLLVYDVDNSDENYAESETVAVTISGETDPPPPPPPPQKWWIWLLVGLVITALLAVIAYQALKDNGPASPQTVAIVPNVTGQLFDDAKTMLEKLEFTKIETTTQFNATKPTSTVLEQTPEADTKVDPNTTTVTLTLAGSITTMPDLKDLVVQGAKERLTKLGLTKIKLEPKFDQSKPIGTVLSQNPQAGESVNATETEITLIVANAGVKVPNVKNKSLKDALFALQSAKLSLGAVSSKYNSSLNEGTVISQDPYSGNVPEKSEVKLVVSTKQVGVIVIPGVFQMIQKSGIPYNPAIARELAPAEEIKE